VIERELDMANMAGQLPPMPEALMRELAESGGEVRITYKAPINRLQRAGKALGILRTVDSLTAAAEITDEALVVFEGKWGEIGREIGEINDVPPSLMNSDEEIAAIIAKKSQQAIAGNLVEAAPQLGRTIKDLAQAQATVKNEPAPIPYVQPA
jgi:ABC-type transporter Mla subunit MlaD